MNIAGLDIGTTGCKCTVYDIQGNLITESYQEYISEISEHSHVLDPNKVWESVKYVLKETTKKASKINAIGVTTFGEAAVFLDENNDPIGKSMLYTDPKGDEECAAIVSEFGQDYLNNGTGLTPGKMYTISKILWVNNHEPERLQKCRRICLFQDYIVFKLSGVFQIDYSLASRTMAFDVKLLQWNETILKFAGVNETYFSKPVPMGTMAGEILKEVAEELNIQDSPIIVSGCHDQLAAAIGTGVFRTGMAVDGTGTVECITNIFEDCKDINKELLYKGGYAIVPFLKDKLATYAFSFTGGALLKWYRDNLANMEAEHIKEIGGNVYEHFNKQVDVTKPSGLLVLPYFAGAGTPFNDSNAKGAILGLTMNTTSSDIYRALMEGVTYEMRLNLEILSKAGININSIRATGGGASSKIWLQMKADILNKPVMSLGAAQSGTLGCVMLAGVACGFYASLEEAEKIFVKENEVYLPNEEMSKKYDQYYKEYKNIYQLISQLEIR